MSTPRRIRVVARSPTMGRVASIAAPLMARINRRNPTSSVVVRGEPYDIFYTTHPKTREPVTLVLRAVAIGTTAFVAYLPGKRDPTEVSLALATI